MFRLVRFFLLTSAAAAAAIVIGLAVYRQNQVERLLVIAEYHNVETARVFANTIWPLFARYVQSASQLSEDELRNHPESRSISQAVETVSAGVSVLKIKIYNLEGLTVYSSDPSEIGENKTNNPGFFSAARLGRAVSKLTFRDELSAFEGTVQHWDLVESYLPIRQADGPVEGVFELYTDVTPLLAGIKRSTVNLAVGFLSVFGALYVILFLIVRRADLTIKEQYADITEKNALLEHEVRAREKAQEALEKVHDGLELRITERTRALTEEIAERERAEDETRRHRDELAHVGRVSIMGEMATSLAHELNQPLTVISGRIQLCTDRLRAEKWKPEQLLDAMEQVSEQADRATQIIRHIREFVSKGEPEKQAVDVNEVIRGIADLLCSDARGYGAGIQLKLNQASPVVNANPVQLQQVILNLAHNGLEAMNDEDSRPAEIMIETFAPRNGAVEIAVRDEGRGICAKNIDRVFDPFFTTKTDGLGMGLAISRSIIEAHGGRLWATSDGETGAVFHFTLPIAERSHDDT